MRLLLPVLILAFSTWCRADVIESRFHDFDTDRDGFLAGAERDQAS